MYTYVRGAAGVFPPDPGEFKAGYTYGFNIPLWGPPDMQGQGTSGYALGDDDAVFTSATFSPPGTSFTYGGQSYGFRPAVAGTFRCVYSLEVTGDASTWEARAGLSTGTYVGTTGPGGIYQWYTLTEAEIVAFPTRASGTVNGPVVTGEFTISISPPSFLTLWHYVPVPRPAFFGVAERYFQAPGTMEIYRLD
jgi:hypothetical protein